MQNDLKTLCLGEGVIDVDPVLGGEAHSSHVGMVGVTGAHLLGSHEVHGPRGGADAEGAPMSHGVRVARPDGSGPTTVRTIVEIGALAEDEREEKQHTARSVGEM